MIYVYVYIKWAAAAQNKISLKSRSLRTRKGSTSTDLKILVDYMYGKL